METMEARRNSIARLVDEMGTVSFSKLKEKFPNVSEMTLRTDLKCLDEEKRILRIHGGAKSVQVLIGTDDLLTRKSYRNIEEKNIIAKKALTLLKPGITFYLDSGSTTTAFARCIPDQPGIIYTSALSCAMELLELEKPEVIMPGGRLNRFSQSVCGISAVRELERVNFDLVFLGVTGCCPSAGFTCGINDEALLKQTAMNRAEQTVVLMDSSKLDVKCSFRICGLSDIDIIISDGKLPADFLDECRRKEVTVL
ncbi:MAG: DeoR/GlpR family DNA-binding transcription regulator [Clostridiales bacterium]|nr:DeoR/GlpR family DNA-binding transcription regulator [Clostridiales bacterium]